MGIQDRDYYWEKRRGNQKSSARKIAKSKSRVKYLLPPLIAMGVIWFSLTVYSKKQMDSNTTPSKSITPAHKPLSHSKRTSRVISIKADRQGHFRGELLINNQVMPFLIDTGATTTAIPKRMAISANLPVGKRIKVKTAGGYVFSNRTRIKKLKVGNITIRNLDATINKHLDEVLVGMNTLNLFKMSINGKYLTLSANKDILNYPNASISPRRIKNTTAIIKKRICDKNNICHTSYSDH